MTTKEWLERGWELHKEIEALSKTKLTLWERCTRVTPAYSAAAVSGTPEPHKSDAYVDYCLRVDSKCEELTKVSGEIFSAIYNLPMGRDSNKYRQFLINRYLNFMTIEETADAMGYERRYAKKLHQEALSALEKTLKDIV